MSPADFVNLFRSAKYVVTDSFHGAALSIIFKRRFIIADREDRMLNMNSRILTLLDRMDLTERFMVDVTVENILNTFANKINFKIANEVIKSNLVESNQYLSKLL
ncbi:hypothetical protein EQG69_09145 [Levilactobacillus brevis]|nr:hypothetical protein EQG69_09145 [Levilactobacillus brevis]